MLLYAGGQTNFQVEEGGLVLGRPRSAWQKTAPGVGSGI